MNPVSRRLLDSTPALGRRIRQRFAGPLARQILARPFGRGSGPKTAIYYEDMRIGYAQVFPFLYYAPALHDRFGAQIRAVPVRRLTAGASPLAGADVVLVQFWFTTPPETIERTLGRLRAAAPEARIGFIDSFAHSDLRLARHLDPYVSHYLKKSLFRDRDRYFVAYRGDTNLTEYYSDLYGLEAEPVDWQVPPTMTGKLHLSPNFFTAPNLMAEFLDHPAPPPQRGREIDVHARLGVKGSPWYQRMRETCLEAARTLARSGRVVVEGRVSPAQYMAEMRAAKVCLSPFGFGEVCWRDIEAMAAGSVLVKPDMGHLETLPDLYVDGETYVACRWDFADLADKVERLIADESRRARIAETAHGRIRRYLETGRFVEDIAFLYV